MQSLYIKYIYNEWIFYGGICTLKLFDIFRAEKKPLKSSLAGHLAKNQNCQLIQCPAQIIAGGSNSIGRLSTSLEIIFSLRINRWYNFYLHFTLSGWMV